MIDVALLSAIRRWHFREGVAVREIVRRTKLARNTVRKYLFGGQLGPVYPKRTSPSKLEPFADTLSSWLERDAVVPLAFATGEAFQFDWNEDWVVAVRRQRPWD